MTDEMERKLFELVKNDISRHNQTAVEGKTLFSGYTLSDGKRRSEYWNAGERGAPIIFLGEQNGGKTGDYVRFEISSSQIWVQKVVSGLPDMHTFGQIDGTTALRYLDMLVDHNTPSILSSQLKLSLETILFENQQSWSITGEEKYDSGNRAIVFIAKHGDVVTQRYWIDESRGYISPLIQIYDPKTLRLVEEYISSDYFKDPETGLWFPTKHFRAQYNAESGDLVEKCNYTISKDTFRINQPISDWEFSVDVPVNTKIFDTREKNNVKYTAMDKGELSLATGGLDLDNMKWLMREGDLTYGRVEPSAVVQWIQFISLPLGIVLILLALFMKYRQWKGQRK